MRHYYFILIFSSISMCCFAQDFSYGKISPADFKVDSPHDAIVLNEYGNASIILSHDNDLVLNYYYHTKIKVLTNNGLNEANFTIPLHRSGTQREVIASIKGTTYNLENDKVIEVDLPKSSIITEKSSENVSLTKIALSNVKEGSIIELRYTVQSPYLYNLQSWSFQSDIPKIRSEFITEIPEICTYNVNLRGGMPLSTRKVESYDTRMETGVGSVRGSKIIYVMENVPAFEEEEYMTSSENYKSILTFELAQYSIPFGKSYNFSRTWTDVETQLLDSENFGKELRTKNLFKQELLSQLINPKDTDLHKAQKVYSYIQQQIKWDKATGLFTKEGIKSALEKRSGNVADINLALVNALQSLGLQASPVILSTRKNGIPSFFHPTVSNYNYVIAHLLVDSIPYLLDATDPNLPFGLLPLHCINYQGRLIAKNLSKSIPLEAAYSSSTSHMFTGNIDEDGSLTGKLQILRFGYSALNKRNEFKNFSSQEEYFESIEEKNNHIQFVSKSVENLNELENYLTENYEIKIDNFAHKSDGSLSFNPFFIDKTIRNPFNLDNRSYPVDLGSKIEEKFSFNINIPTNYALVHKPKNTNMALPNRDARYLYIITNEPETLDIQTATQLNKALFMPEEYLDLKEFYSRIIQSQKVDISLVKK